MKKKCKRCSLDFTKKPSDSREYWVVKVFCSKKCANIFNSFSSHQKLRGRQRPIEVREKCLKTAFPKGNKPWNVGKPFLQMRGERHHNWKGGITKENNRIRTSLEYKLWRRAVFERDDFTCVDCGIRGGTLHADHIKPFALYHELRFAIDNGRTLCKPCHMKTPTYGFSPIYNLSQVKY